MAVLLSQNIGTTKCRFIVTFFAFKPRKIICILILILAFLTFDCEAPWTLCVTLWTIKSHSSLLHKVTVYHFSKIKHHLPLSMCFTFIGLLTLLLSNNLKLPGNEANYGQYHNGKQYFIWDIWAMCMNCYDPSTNPTQRQALAGIFGKPTSTPTS